MQNYFLRSGLVLFAVIATILTLGAIYQFTESRIDFARHPAPGKLIDVGRVAQPFAICAKAGVVHRMPRAQVRGLLLDAGSANPAFPEQPVIIFIFLSLSVMT